MYDDIDFTVLYGDDIISDKNESEPNSMILYTYINETTEKELLKYYAFLKIKPTEIDRRDLRNPIQLPLVLYEYPDIAKALAQNNSTTLLKVNVKTDILQIYDMFNPFSVVKEHDKNVLLIRKKSKYNNTNKEYISYIVKDHRLILDIQLG